MIKLNIHEIKTQLSKYIELVEAGETVLVCKRNIPVAEIRSIGKTKQKRKPVLGWAEGQGMPIEPMIAESAADAPAG